MIRFLVVDGVVDRGGELLFGDRLVLVNEYSLDNSIFVEVVEVLKVVLLGIVRFGICKFLVVSVEFC